ncbi:hypothetical protein CAPTEDRAFT_225890 [Capitella teleta]|uniref:Apple domain-containing protein n=1 Tax=Capitella teleta TaxID=283909 RepID=R7VGL6_CAPTE|nr:hypothetical protein CAPTEDRAFT_225890 [Capitella teleta]|eukprot:ELU14835.1 hypothetical protein CAPTEDRAFT_225890 [Capitella teleta]
MAYLMKTLWALLLVLLWNVNVLEAVRYIETVLIDECIPSKYFWQEKDPRQFYACLKDKRAIRMMCGDNSYMCNTGDEKFLPCSCKGRPPTISNKLTKDAKKLQNYAKMGIEEQSDAESVAKAERQKQKEAEIPDADDKFESLPAKGCPDLFRRYPKSHMHQGTWKEQTTLIECQRACLATRNCIGVDWDRRDNVDENRRCYHIFPESMRYGIAPKPYACCDHYRRTYCLSSDIDIEENLVDKNDIYDNDLNPYEKQGNSQVTDSNLFGNTDTTTQATSELPLANRNAATSTDIAQPTTPQTAAPSTTQAVTQPTTTIPDSGCPFAFREYPAVNHPFGENITSSTENRNVEECKYWCLIRPHCVAVDFNTDTETCYSHREIKDSLIDFSTPKPSVTHYRKTTCSPPLRCWLESKEISTEDDFSVTDINTPQSECIGVCYLRQTVNAAEPQTIQRGCMRTNGPLARKELGCRLDESQTSIVCLCDTMMCNGLSMVAQLNIVLHLPLDGDFLDHSGMGRDGRVTRGYNAPTFTCLERSVNCSALFSGSECISIPSLALTSYGSVRSANRAFVPQASFIVFYKRASYSENSEGIFGNADEKNKTATWRIQASKIANMVSAGVVTEMSGLEDLSDFYAIARDFEWHQAALTYDGLNSPDQGFRPTSRFFVDGTQADGNSILDQGPISVRRQAVTIGCVSEENFTGFIDEAMIFSMALPERDIAALRAMRDANFAA